MLRIAEAESFEYADVDHLGSYREDNTYNWKHIDSVLALKLVDVEAIRKADFRVAIDCVNSVGGIILPELLERLGVNISKSFIVNLREISNIIPNRGKELGRYHALDEGWKGGCCLCGRSRCGSFGHDL